MYGGGDDPKYFYVTLFGNASTILHQDNTIATFTAELARTIELGSNEKSKVGVYEFAYPPKQMGALKASTVVGDTTGLIYCDLIRSRMWVKPWPLSENVYLSDSLGSTRVR